MSDVTNSINQFYMANCHSDILKYKSAIAYDGVDATNLNSIKSFVSEFSANGRPVFLRYQEVLSYKCSFQNFIEHYPNLKTSMSGTLTLGRNIVNPEFSKIINKIVFMDAPELVNIEKIYVVKKAYEAVLDIQQRFHYPVQISKDFPVFNSAAEHFDFNINPFGNKFDDDFPNGSINVQPYIDELRAALLAGGQSHMAIEHDEI